eukprot:2787834-Amphidinium_carterae.1
MLSGRSTVVAAAYSCSVGCLLAEARFKLGLEDDGSTMELWNGSGERAPDDTEVEGWPGIKPPGQISEYQLLVVVR